MAKHRVGIIGAGQLGRMMALSSYPLGIRCEFVDTSADSPGGQVAPIRVAELDDEQALMALARDVDVVTFDIENVSVPLLQKLESVVPVHPSPALVAQAQDRLTEKQLFQHHGIPTAPFTAINDSADLDTAASELGFPVVLKARRLGYDGRGQRIAHSIEELTVAWSELGEVAAIAEGWVPFECEVSLIGARGQGGDIRFYPLSENRHTDGMLESSVAPYTDDALQAQAEQWMQTLLEQHNYQGVLTIEFFLTSTGLVANEMAPRVHNSGHWTIEGAATSQFENHIRAVVGLPLGSTTVRGTAAMRNLVGSVPPSEQLLAQDGLHLHDYGKTPRPLRKVGHCTIVSPDRATALEQLNELDSLLAAGDL